MFASIDLARRIESAEARLSREIASGVRDRRPEANALVEPISGGVAVYSGPESPINKLIGIGFEPDIDESKLRLVEDSFAERGAKLQAEVSTLADPHVHEMLCTRGYVLQGFENVLGRPLGLADLSAEPITSEDVQGVPPADMPVWASLLVDGFQHPDEQGVAGEPLPPRDVIERIICDMSDVPSMRRYVVHVQGAMVAGASMRIDDGVAQLAGSATLREFRRRGLQTALIRSRLIDGVRLGCDVAVVTTSPGSRSQQNLQKQGFHLLYSRALLIKSPPQAS